MNIKTNEVFKQKLHSKYTIGPFCKTEDPAFIEVMGNAGFDFVILDMEHGPNNIQSMQNLIRAGECSGTSVIVRVTGAFPDKISAALDIGAAGVQVPMVSSIQDAKNVVLAAKYYPKGSRGVCRYVRAANYSARPADEYFKSANDAVIIVQIENQMGIDNLDDILSVEGIDVIFMGSYDISQTLGIPGKVKDPGVVDTIKKINERCRARGVQTGTFVERIEDVKFWHALGMNYICYSVDVGLLFSACSTLMDTIHKVV